MNIVNCLIILCLIAGNVMSENTRTDYERKTEGVVQYDNNINVGGVVLSIRTILTSEKGVPSVKGQYGNTFPDGSTVQVTFTADERGFLPKVKFEKLNPHARTIPKVENRIPTSAIVTITGGGVG